MPSFPTYFVDPIAKDARAIECPDASFENGCNYAASNAAGIGINVGVEPIPVEGSAEQFTLLDQWEGARTPQISQSIGGLPYVDRNTTPYPSSGGTGSTLPDEPISVGENATNDEKEADPSLDGFLTNIGDATLETLEGGWTVPLLPFVEPPPEPEPDPEE